MRPMTAKGAGLVPCPACHKLNRADANGQGRCGRCGAHIAGRKPASVQRTWAWTVAAMIAFIPANALPIMTVVRFGHGHPDTILSGIRTLMQMGMAPVAMIVFMASVVIPLGKIVGLVILLVSVQRHSAIRPRHKGMLYHMLHLLGPWSMLDIFVVALMVAVVRLGFITSVEAGPGAAAFATLVILTLMATESFDPRLIWDQAEPHGGDDDGR